MRPDKPKEEGEEAKVAVKTESKEKLIPVRCRECRAILDDPDLLMFPGDPDDAVSWSLVF